MTYVCRECGEQIHRDESGHWIHMFDSRLDAHPTAPEGDIDG